MSRDPGLPAPVISRNRAAALPFSISAAAWVDLLGYPLMITITSIAV